MRGLDDDVGTRRTAANLISAHEIHAHTAVVVLPDGKVVSRYGDPVWDYSELAGHVLKIHFGGRSVRHDSLRLGSANSSLLKRAAYYLQGPTRRKSRPQTIVMQVKQLVPIFKLCERNGIVASDLSRFPRVWHQVAPLLKSKAKYTLGLLHELYGVRDVLGFYILDPECLRALSLEVPQELARQTPYIPPRLWLYQVKRLREMLDDYNEHKDAVEALWSFCIGAFERNYGNLSAAFDPSRSPSRSPFAKTSKALRGCVYVGPFLDVARRFGVAGLIERWALPPGRTLGQRDAEGARHFSSYLTAVSIAGGMYLCNYSGMRRNELMGLRSSCLIVDHDEVHGDVYLLRSATSKTISDRNALWITSSGSQTAVSAMRSVAKMRMGVAAATGLPEFRERDVTDPPLFLRPYEPWGLTRMYSLTRPLSVRKMVSYRQLIALSPRLFDDKCLEIGEDDLRVALGVTPSLDTSSFGLGAIWRFSIHQLRRTLIVNAAHSGVVSDASVQYEMKHQSRAMSIYYGRGYSELKLDLATRQDFVRALGDALAAKGSELAGDEFLSPLGRHHKDNITRFLNPKEEKELLALAKAGKLAIRETLLGVCLSRTFCPYGGLDHVVDCLSCNNALIDKRRAPMLSNALVEIENQLSSARMEGPTKESLLAQKTAIGRAIDAITSN